MIGVNRFLFHIPVVSFSEIETPSVKKREHTYVVVTLCLAKRSLANRACPFNLGRLGQHLKNYCNQSGSKNGQLFYLLKGRSVH